MQSYSLMLMGARFGIKIHGDDSDLAWIPYMLLTTQLPPVFEKQLIASTHKDKIIQKLCYLKFGEHPGDHYFRKMIDSYTARREHACSTMTPEEIKRYK